MGHQFASLVRYPQSAYNQLFRNDGNWVFTEIAGTSDDTDMHHPLFVTPGSSLPFLDLTCDRPLRE